MKVPGFMEFRPFLNDDQEMRKYLNVDMVRNLRELTSILRKLRFEDNFTSWIEDDLTIGGGSEVQIRNMLDPEIPSMRLVVRGGAGAENVVDGTTAWTSNYVYLQNTGGSSVTVDVLFLK